MASGNYCVPGSDKVRLAGAKAAVIASAEGVREGESILASPALSSDWQRRTNVWRRLTSPARRAKRLRKRGIPQAGLIRWVQIIALCLGSRRHFQCCPQPWSQRAMLTSNDYKELAARCTELASESSEPTVAEALRALASDYLARAAKLHFVFLEPRHEAARHEHCRR